jgi:hypothetical protein
MSAPAVSPEPAKTPFSWKRLFIRAAGFGAGFALILCLTVGGWLWYSSRPEQPTPWDHKSITAEYDHPQIYGEKNHIMFGYILINHTAEDVRIESDAEVTYMLKAIGQNAISTMPKSAFKIDYPVIIPGHERVYFPLELNMSYKEAEKDGLPIEERRKFRKEIEAFFRSKYENIGGFQLMVENKRMVIDLPGGWNELKK